MDESINIRGARVHNRKNVSVSIPHNQITVVAGVSGSGKSSLAFNTIYAEVQRRCVESMSAYDPANRKRLSTGGWRPVKRSKRSKLLDPDHIVISTLHRFSLLALATRQNKYVRNPAPPSPPALRSTPSSASSTTASALLSAPSAPSPTPPPAQLGRVLRF